MNAMKNLSAFLERRAGTRRTIVLAAIGSGAGLAIMLALGGLRHPSAAAAGAPVVEIGNYMFMPGTVTIPVGGSVTWVNHDGDIHSVAADDTPPTFKSGGLDTDDKFTFTFTKAGVYTYHCSLHPHMIGKIIVQ
jgi:plastocyanin